MAFMPCSRADNNSLSSGIMLCPGQALGIPFHLLSASDPNMKCKDFVHMNFGRNKPTHWFPTMDDQRKGTNCTDHVGKAGCCKPAPSDIDLMMVGGPCHPFSTQRVGRYSTGNVEAHFEYGVTFKDIGSLLLDMEPRSVISEQVEGFDKPIAKGRGPTDTPLKRLDSHSVRQIIGLLVKS